LLNRVSSTLLLSEQLNNVENKLYSTIYKYQPLNQLLTQVMGHCLENDQSIHTIVKGHERTKVLSVYSAVGGLGKTTLAINLAKELAALDYTIFYLNLEYISSSSLFFTDSKEQTFSDILYYLETRPEQILSKIESLKKHDHKMKVDYFSPLKNPQEMLDISLEQTSLLIQSLINLGNYDLVIIDLESSTHDRIVASFIHSDHIFWLTTDDIQCLMKTNILLKDFKVRCNEHYKGFETNITFIMAKYIGITVNSLEDYGLKVRGKIPYIPGWKSTNDIDSLLNSTIYSEQVLNLHTSLLSDLRGKEH
jgi:cellulose biosynthesis protein BcsQ